ncbi:fimbrial protein [Escherichia coli]|uniref:Fimbrial protein n=1 Tax=Escherichia albertii TaxID=208962 RepID=A0AAX3MVE6_ESCAL|nr:MULTISPECIES: fimbrial protein [Escherichia]MCZ8654890.1 fimbrial protein [Escherichia albertii]MEC4939957.1 fimbrial protein [Escherichia coli]MEC4960889.1 fimbrial protein [Escherichia coli]MEC5139622.1 fimbrial protein [Escherichia coli]WDB31905.1 fimbrial protein [Escherichia albertii]
MSLRVWAVAGGMMLMWGIRGYAADDGSLSDTLEKTTTINFSVHVKEPTCQIDVPDSVDFGEPGVTQMIGRGVSRDFTITLKNCTQRIPKPGLVFSGDMIDDDGYIRNKSGSDYAGGVGIRLLFRGKPFSIQEGVVLDEVGTSGPKSFGFTAHLGKEGSDEVTAGKVETSVVVSMTYN